MALGKPVIATNGGGTNEVVIENENGFLIQPGDTKGLLNNLTKLINDKTLRDRLGERGSEMAREKFDIKKMAKNYVSVYENLVK